MGLPKTPPGVTQAREDIPKLEKQEEKLSKPSKQSGYTLENVPGPTSVLVYEYWYDNEGGRLEGTKMVRRVYNPEVYPDKQPEYVSAIYAYNPSGDPNFLPRAWVTRDPYKPLRESLQEKERQRVANLHATIEERYGKEEYAGKWTRSSGDASDRPGARRYGSTLLTGGLGLYGKPDVKKSKLGG